MLFSFIEKFKKSYKILFIFIIVEVLLIIEKNSHTILSVRVLTSMEQMTGIRFRKGNLELLRYL